MKLIRRKDIELPHMRLEVIGALESLGDVEEQKGWIKPEYPYSFWSFMVLSSSILDDLPFEKSPEGQIGYTVLNQEELEVVMKSIEALNKVVDKIGMKKPDHEYINSPLWQKVVQASQKAYELLSKNDEEYLKSHPEALVT